jgi:putative ATP-binding cassette transporter
MIIFDDMKNAKLVNGVGLYSFLKKETKKPYRNIVIMAIISGIANAFVLGIINAASKVVQYENANFQYFLLFLIMLILFIVTEFYILKQGSIIMEEIIDNVRIRLIDKIRKADLINLEKIGQTEVYNRLTMETTTISQSAGLIVATLQSIVMLFFVVIYIGYLSLTAFFLIIILLIGGISIYIKNDKIQKRLLRETNIQEMAFFSSLTSTLFGIKEIKFNNKRDKSLFSHIKGISSKLKNQKITSSVKYAQNYIFSQSFFFVSIATVVFVLPRLSVTFPDVVTQSTAAILFMIGPVSNIAAVIPVIDKVRIAINHIYDLESELDKMQDVYIPDNSTEYEKFFGFQTIDFKNIFFTYKNSEQISNFSIGPFSFNIKQGELIFLIGGNGSGKTTLLKTMTMLYYPDEGGIFIDNEEISKNDVPYYRELFTSIFAEYYLFDKLYGISNCSPEVVNELLKYLQIDKKTSYEREQFTNLNLSTGQKKRLALIVSLLEDKPIYIFDEWAADQDPEFREFFYEHILDELKRKGKTIIVVSHDDRYFKYADRILKMEYGKIFEINN